MRSGLLCLVLWSSSAVADPAPVPANSITVAISNIRNDNGQAMCELFATADGFPGDASKAIQRTKSVIHGGVATCEFPGLNPGAYAVAVFHDENSNGTMDKNFFGIPKEGVGTSNDAKGFMGPPKFDAARFEFKGGALRLAVKMAYL